MGVGRLNSDSKYRRIDILCIPFEQWGAALIYFTGKFSWHLCAFGTDTRQRDRKASKENHDTDDSSIEV